MKEETSNLEALLRPWNNDILTRYCELSNASAYIFSIFDNVSWAGFYIKDKDSLILGPFQGKIACTNIPFDKGVCGKAYRSRQTIVVDNVHTVQDHIACDSDTNSEIVVPLIYKNDVVGVIDLDSTNFSRFKKQDVVLLEEFAMVIVNKLFA